MASAFHAYFTKTIMKKDFIKEELIYEKDERTYGEI